MGVIVAASAGRWMKAAQDRLWMFYITVCNLVFSMYLSTHDNVSVVLIVFSNREGSKKGIAKL